MSTRQTGCSPCWRAQMTGKVRAKLEPMLGRLNISQSTRPPRPESPIDPVPIPPRGKEIKSRFRPEYAGCGRKARRSCLKNGFFELTWEILHQNGHLREPAHLGNTFVIIDLYLIIGCCCLAEQSAFCLNRCKAASIWTGPVLSRSKATFSLLWDALDLNSTLTLGGADAAIRNWPAVSPCQD